MLLEQVQWGWLVPLRVSCWVLPVLLVHSCISLVQFILIYILGLLVGDLNQDRLNQAKSFGCKTVDLSRQVSIDELFHKKTDPCVADRMPLSLSKLRPLWASQVRKLPISHSPVIHFLFLSPLLQSLTVPLTASALRLEGRHTSLCTSITCSFSAVGTAMGKRFLHKC